MTSINIVPELRLCTIDVHYKFNLKLNLMVITSQLFTKQC